MAENVTLQVESWQKIPDGNEDRTDFTCSAQYYCKNGNQYLVYQEVIEGLSGSKTILKIDISAQKVYLQRNKPYRFYQTFKIGDKIEGIYILPQGELKLETKTHRLDIGHEKVVIQYSIYLNDHYISENKLCFNWIKQGG